MEAEEREKEVTEQDEKNLIEVLKATGELYGRTVSVTAATMLLADLSGFDPKKILEALSRCRKELRTFPTVADIVARIDDGRPGVEQAWAMIPKDEEASVVWTQEMSQAYGVARPLLLSGDEIAARMSFKEVYSGLIAEARARNTPVQWIPSFGMDKSEREAALLEAVQKGRISMHEAQTHIPEIGTIVKGGELQLNGPPGLFKLSGPGMKI